MNECYVIKDERISSPDRHLPVAPSTFGRGRAMVVRKPPLYSIENQQMIPDPELYSSLVSLKHGVDALREQITVLQSGWYKTKRIFTEQLNTVVNDLEELRQKRSPEKQSESGSTHLRNSSHMPFPLNSVDDVRLFDEHLSNRVFRSRVKAHLEQCYQPDLAKWIRAILRFCVSTELARQTNMYGRFGKFAFRYTKLYRLLFAITLPPKPSEQNQKMAHAIISSWFRSR